VIPVARTKVRTVETTVTYLEMTAPSALHVPAPANIKLALMRAENPPVHFYRYLYHTIGRKHHWVDRRRMSDSELAATINAPDVEIFAAYANGVPAGYFELDCRDHKEIWLAYFGIIPEFRGRGLGKWLLSEALAAAWLKEPERVRVETCTLDDPRALPLYQRMGFVPYERRQKVMEV
jgi:GNAT superfamily N-acetyltransferase